MRVVGTGLAVYFFMISIGCFRVKPIDGDVHRSWHVTRHHQALLAEGLKRVNDSGESINWNARYEDIVEMAVATLPKEGYDPTEIQNDGWGQKMSIVVVRDRHVIRSFGPNCRDEDGGGDDIDADLAHTSDSGGLSSSWFQFFACLAVVVVLVFGVRAWQTRR